MPSPQTKVRIIKAADKLFYEQGFEYTSFAHIASAVGISRGNFYHHFKTKDALLDAVIAYRLSERESMLSQWELEGSSPIERIQSFINILVVNGGKIKKYGCPIGTLSAELMKVEHPLRTGANGLFTVFRIWLCKQFDQLGMGEKSDELAMHVLAFSQGVASLANAFQDDQFVENEISRINTWLEQVSGPNESRLTDAQE